MFKELNDLCHFLEYPKRKIHVREYARLQNITPATASTILKKFQKQDILKKEIIQNIHLYSLQSSQIVKDLKVFYTIQKIRTIIPQLNAFFGKPHIILFGSASKGEDNEQSDIDLYVESEVTSQIIRNTLEKKLKRPLQLFVYKQIQDVPNKYLQQNIMNGIVLQGELKWIWTNVKKKDLSDK